MLKKPQINQTSFAETLAKLLANDASFEESCISAGFVEAITIQPVEPVKRLSCAEVIDELIDLDIDIASDSPDL